MSALAADQSETQLPRSVTSVFQTQTVGSVQGLLSTSIQTRSDEADQGLGREVLKQLTRGVETGQGFWRRVSRHAVIFGAEC